MANEPGSDRPTDRTTCAQGNQSLVSRWSRRKSAARARHRRANHADDGQALDAASADDGSEEPRAGEQDSPTDADMPSIDSLGEGSDYRGFLSPRVSESLQRAALRKLFQSPRFNVRDGLDDYDGDYTRYLPMDDDTVTAHAKFQAARLRERLGAETAADMDPPSTGKASLTHLSADPGSASRGPSDSDEPESEDADAPRDDPA